MYDTLPDRQGLLAPKKPDSPAGSDLHGTDLNSTNLNSTDLFLLTRDIRNAARDNERLRAQGNACDNTRLRAQWQQVANQCCTLITHSKDLDVCAWLMEAWSRLNGLRGIADGCTLYREVLTQFWDCLFPAPESADDMAARVSALNALNGGSRTGTLVEAINHFAITYSNRDNNDDSDDHHTGFALWQYRAAIDAQRIADDDKRQQRFTTLGFSLLQIRQAADDTAITSYQTLLADCDTAQEALRQLDDALTNRLGSHSPSTTLINNALDDLRDALNHLAGKRLASEIVVAGHDTDSATADINHVMDTNSTLQSTLHSTPRQRCEAIAQLETVARYFRTMEPHSPLACAIDRLVRWANMPYDELMRELIPDHSARDVLWLMAGIAPDSQRC